MCVGSDVTGEKRSIGLLSTPNGPYRDHFLVTTSLSFPSFDTSRANVDVLASDRLWGFASVATEFSIWARAPFIWPAGAGAAGGHADVFVVYG